MRELPQKMLYVVIYNANGLESLYTEEERIRLENREKELAARLGITLTEDELADRREEEKARREEELESRREGES